MSAGSGAAVDVEFEGSVAIQGAGQPTQGEPSAVFEFMSNSPVDPGDRGLRDAMHVRGHHLWHVLAQNLRPAGERAGHSDQSDAVTLGFPHGLLSPTSSWGLG